MNIKLASIEDALALSKYYSENAEHLQAWEPKREKDYHGLESWQQRLADMDVEQNKHQAAHFIMVSNSVSEIVGVCNLTGVVRGCFQACYMGFSVAKKHQGQGVMMQLGEHAIRYAFETLDLNRVMANHMLSNRRSAALLKRLGFSEEGLAKKYLFINGCWEDHVLNAVVNSESMESF